MEFSNTGFYFWKAKNENMIKIGRNCGDEGVD